MAGEARRRRAIAQTIEEDLRFVATARFSEMRDLWRERLGAEPPVSRSREIFRRMLAYRLQELAFGGLPGSARKKLRDIEERERSGVRPPPPLVRLNAGVTLVRVWKGVRYEVRVVKCGFVYAGQTFASLSEVAREITGTRWNGPLFFGLREKRKESA